MSQVELVWGAFSLMFFGALVSMCMKCQRTGSKQQKANFNSQRNQCENQQRFEVMRSCSMSGQERIKMPYDMPGPSKSNEHLSTASHLGACAKPKYQNCGKGMQMEPDAAYVEPIPSNPYYNCRKFTRTSSGDDSHSYQNVAGPSKSEGCNFVDMGVYENSAEIQSWKHSQISENWDDDDEPDYINAAADSRFPA